MYLGSVYEISLHSLEDYDHSVVKIMNGYHSGRTVGAPLTDLALNMLKELKTREFPPVRILPPIQLSMPLENP